MIRVLSSQGIFKEAAPDVFVNNRLSIVLDKGLTQSELDGNPTRFVVEFSSSKMQDVPYCFELRSPLKTLVLRANSDIEMQEWLNMFLKQKLIMSGTFGHSCRL